MGTYLIYLWNASPRTGYKELLRYRPDNLLNFFFPPSLMPSNQAPDRYYPPEEEHRRKGGQDLKNYDYRGNDPSGSRRADTVAPDEQPTASSPGSAYLSPVPSLVADTRGSENDSVPDMPTVPPVSVNHSKKGSVYTEQKFTSLNSREWAMIVYGVDLEAPAPEE